MPWECFILALGKCSLQIREAGMPITLRPYLDTIEFHKTRFHVANKRKKKCLGKCSLQIREAGMPINT